MKFWPHKSTFLKKFHYVRLSCYFTGQLTKDLFFITTFLVYLHSLPYSDVRSISQSNLNQTSMSILPVMLRHLN